MAKEYIERDAALMGVMRAGCLANTVQVLKDIPAADVVEVVRCKDCKYWHEETGWCYQHSHFIKYGENGVAFCHPWESADWKMFDADYFCKDGERRDNNAAD